VPAFSRSTGNGWRSPCPGGALGGRLLAMTRPGTPSTRACRPPALLAACSLAAWLLASCLLAGCHGGALHAPLATGGGGRMLENPLFVACGDRQFLWHQVVDTLDDYFRIEREDQVRLIGDVLTEGRIDTYP